MISSAFRINEGMTMQILQNIEKRMPSGKVAIFGMAFKANCDDTRNSLSFKMRRQLEFKGYETVCVDPNVAGTAPIEAIRGCDAVVLMSPHREFKDLSKMMAAVGNPGCWFVDLWGFWTDMRHRSDNGYFQASEVSAP
jgi:UDP-N-acetyl-D-mannosaminuronic acid dehydrogenase